MAAVATLGTLPAQIAAAVADKGADALAEMAAGDPRSASEAADLQLRYDQEDGPESGHVRVTLTPEIRPLTPMEARWAAQQAFLKALDEPGLGDDIRRVRVVVRLMPASHPDPDGAEQVIVYDKMGGHEWSVQTGE